MIIRQAHDKAGFTLIELIVVITLIIIFSSMSMVAYFQFSQRQETIDDARNFVTVLRRFQAKAKNLVYPAGCTGLVRYNLKSDGFGEDNETSKKVTAKAICANNTYTVITGEKVLDKTYFANDVDVNFQAGSGNISPVGTYSLTNTNDSYRIVVTTDINGNIDAKEQ